MKRIAFVTASLAAAAAVLLGGLLRESSSAASPAISREVQRELASGFSSADTSVLVRQLQDAARARPDDPKVLGLLGLAYQQRARETGDSSYYVLSVGVLQRALREAPEDLNATLGLGSLALSRHRFRDALVIGRRAQRIQPDSARAYGVVGDALVELGRYREAFAAFDRMSALKPNVSSYSRVAYARELEGHVPAAIRAMNLALDASLGRREASAWTAVQLGKLHWSRGELASADAAFRGALRLFPGYVYALDARSLIEAAHGNLGAAIALEQHAVEAIPLPQFVAQLGDLQRLAGQQAAARKQYATVAVIAKLLAANGVKSDLELALFRVDHGIRLRESLALARSARDDRPGIIGDDVLSWGLARNGRCTDARTFSQRALRLGTQDALMFFHRGFIERCLGNDGAARTWFRRALDTNPHFSLLWAPVARKALS